MNSMTKRLSIALAATALAGGTLLGFGGSASAAPISAPVQHTQPRSVQAATHKGEAASWDGVSATRWYQDQVAEAHSSRGVSASRWYWDQVEEAHSSRGVTAARWYADQVAWSLNHS